jgi:hypothetical protein
VLGSIAVVLLGSIAVELLGIAVVGVGQKVLATSHSGKSARCGPLQLAHLGFKCSQGVLELQVGHLWLVV